MADKPNVVFMLADNVGWGDLACYGGLVPTPRLDKLAQEGTRFTNFNAEAQCTPTRSALMTGRYPVRSGTFRVPAPGEPGHYGLSPWEYTMGNLFSDAGYATACWGKWHLGNVRGRIPTDQGFDEWWGITESSDEAAWSSHPMFPPGVPTPKIKTAVKGGDIEVADEFNVETRPFMDEKITEKTIDFIRRNHAEDRPFFAYVGFTNVHPPMIPHPDFADATNSLKAAPKSIAELDYRAGQILDVIDELGIADDTIVVWVSDNAAARLTAEPMGSGGQWAGRFGGGWEGSMRVPAMIRWPGKIPSGVVTEEMVSMTDWYTTLAGLIGESERVPTDRPIDGVDMSSFFGGETETSGRDTFLYIGTDGKPIATKWKTMKIHFRYAMDDGWTSPYVTPQLPMVYDLVSDPQETMDLVQADLTIGWVLAPALAPIIALAESQAQFPNIAPGADFDGYDS
jgi:arylsulfatase